MTIQHARDRARPRMQQALRFLIALVFFMIPWWMPLSSDSSLILNYVRFLITIPVLAAIGLWLLLGIPGLAQALGDRRRWWIVAMIAVMLWARISPAWSLYPDDSLGAAQQFATAIMFALMALSVAGCAGGPTATDISIALAMGIIFQSVIAITQIGLQHSVGLQAFGEFDLDPMSRGVSIILMGQDRWLRPYALANHPNTLGGYLMAALLCLTGWLYTDGGLSRWRKVLRVFVAGLGLYCLLLTFSRDAWGAFVVGLIAVAFAWTRKRAERPSRRRVMLAAALAVIITVGFSLIYSRYIVARTGTQGDRTEARSISDRRLYTGIALQAIYEHPLNGIGLGAFPSFADGVIQSGPYNGWLSGDYVHNVPLLVASDLGVIGLILWLAAWVIGLVTAWRTVYEPFAVGLVAASVALLATGLLDHYSWSMFHFALLLWGGLGIALSSEVRSRQIAEVMAQKAAQLVGGP